MHPQKRRGQRPPQATKIKCKKESVLLTEEFSLLKQKRGKQKGTSRVFSHREFSLLKQKFGKSQVPTRMGERVFSHRELSLY